MKLGKRDAAIEAFQAGVRSHQAGVFAEAEAAYRQALGQVPDFAECLALLGVLLHQTGRSDQAIQHLLRAATLQPSAAQHQHNLGGVLRDVGRASEAVVAYRKALRLQPNLADSHRNLGCALRDLGQLEQAADSFRAALSLNPAYVDAANDIGNVLVALRRPQEALGCFEFALQLRPTDPTLRNNLGIALRALDRSEQAIACFREAVRLSPDYANAWANLGNALQEKEDAAAALDCLNRAAALAPTSADSFVNLGAALYRQRRLRDSLDVFRRGLETAPGSAALTWNLAHPVLALGDYGPGWAAFEARWQMPDLASGWHKSTAPTWKPGQSLAGKTILLFAEQGFGDTIQFARFAPLLTAQGARVILLVQPALASLLAGMEGISGCFGFGEKLPRFDLQYPLMSLPYALGIQLESVPANCPYLTAAPGAVAKWRDRLGSLPGRKVGLVWAGDPRPDQPEANRTDRRRSLRFNQLAPLAGIEGVSFVSLQKGRPAEQARTQIPGLTLHDWTPDLHSFADTAALVQNLDLVVSVDTSVAHLAGALDRPVWLLNRFDSCWRWLDERDDSPWYPNLRQFRQSRPGDWDQVLARVREELATDGRQATAAASLCRTADQD